jgi:hypothetical protein
MVVVAMVPPGGRSRSGRYMYACMRAAAAPSEANCPASQFREISLSRIHAMIPAAATRNQPQQIIATLERAIVAI